MCPAKPKTELLVVGSGEQVVSLVCLGKPETELSVVGSKTELSVVGSGEVA